MGLYQKYRPKTLEGVYGNEQVVATLDKMFQRNDIPHALLFTGATGCGKTTLARIVAHQLGVVGSDFVELNTADFTGIDGIRHIRNQMQFAPMNGTARFFLLDEVHQLSNQGQNALLKLLEDPPSHVYFVLATTDPQKLLKTIKGRCSVFEMKVLPEKDMFRLLRKVAHKEGANVGKTVFEKIVDLSEGHPRNALQLLEQVIQHTGEEEQMQVLSTQIKEESEAIELSRALLQNSGWKKVSAILRGLRGGDMERIRYAVLGYMASVLSKTANDKAALVIEEFSEPFWNTGFAGLVYACYSIVKG